MALILILFVLAYPAQVDRSFDACDQRFASWHCLDDGQLVAPEFPEDRAARDLDRVKAGALL